MLAKGVAVVCKDDELRMVKMNELIDELYAFEQTCENFQKNSRSLLDSR